MFEKASQTIHCYLDHCCTNKTFKSLHVFLYRRAIGIGFIVTEVLRNEKSHRSQSLFLCKELRVHSHISPCFQDVLYNKLKKKVISFRKKRLFFPRCVFSGRSVAGIVIFSGRASTAVLIKYPVLCYGQTVKCWCFYTSIIILKSKASSIIKILVSVCVEHQQQNHSR